ncbi:hypothetical protein [Maribacter sp. 2307ULW6-5]|uniref:hypothetical protein n=1 Tax=Maribacter sp. 2307ULW6-5 TaxID=3386275 RepID=UPI0039BC7C64
MILRKLIALNMWEFATEWTENDPKWIAVFIIVGGYISWTGYRDYKKEQKNGGFKMTTHNILNIGRDISGFLILLFGLAVLFKKLFAILF